MLLYLLFNVFILIVFLPGIFIVHLLNKKYCLSLSFASVIIIGSLIWNYCLVVPSIIVGVLSLSVLKYFQIFVFLSGLIVLSIMIYILFSFLYSQKIYKFNFSGYSLQYKIGFIYIFLIYFFIILRTFYSPIDQNVDALLSYLPMAKAIVKTNSLTYNPYYLSYLHMTTPPLLPIIYAFSLYITSGFYLRFLPPIYLFLTSIVVYQISLKISNKKQALISMAVYSSLISTQLITSNNGLYLDLGYLFYFIMAIYSLMEYNENNNNKIWLLTFGIGGALTSLSKELGLLGVFLLISLLILKNSKFYKVASIFIVMIPFLFPILNYLVEIILQLELLYPSYIIGKIIVVFIALFGFYFTTHKIKYKKNIAYKDLLYVLLIIIPSIIFYIRNILYLNVITPNILLQLKNKLYSLNYYNLMDMSSTILGLNVPTWLDFLQYQKMFFSTTLGAPYLFFLIPGLFSIIYKYYKRKDNEYFLYILMFFIFQVTMWSLQFKCSDNFRRLYYLSPLISIFIGEGLYFISEKLIITNFILPSFYLYNSAILYYIWNYIYESNYPFLSFMPNPKIIDLWMFFSFFLLFLFTCKFIKNIYLYNYEYKGAYVFKNLIKIKTKNIPIILVIIISFLIPTYLIYKNGIEIQQHYNLSDPSFSNLPHRTYSEIINYYNIEIKDNYTTVGFVTYPLIFFADRQVIDVWSTYSFVSLEPFLRQNSTNQLLDMLYENDLRYFLIPNADTNMPTNIRSARRRYEVMADEFLLFRIIINDIHFIPLKYFKEQTLYKLIDKSDIKKYNPRVDTFENEGSLDKWSIKNGIWNVENGKLLQSSNISGARTFIGNTSWRNYEVSVKMNMLDNVAAGLIFRALNSSHYYVFSVNLNEQEVELWKVISDDPRGKGHILLAEKHVSTDLKRVYTLTVNVKNDLILCFIDDMLIISINDDNPFLHGNVGLWTWRTAAYFDDVAVFLLED